MHRFVIKEQCKCVLQRSGRRTYSRQQRHDGSKSPPLPEMREAGFGKLLFLLSPIVAVGGVVTYAKYDPEFRKTVEKSVPGAETLIKVALSEETTFQNIKKTLEDRVSGATKSIDGITSMVSGLIGGSDAKPKETVQIDKTESKSSALKQKDDSAKEKATEISNKPSIVRSKPEALPNNIIELEKAIEVSASLAVKEYRNAINVLKSFNEDVRKIVDQSVESGDNRFWITLKNKTKARDSFLETAEQHARDSATKIEHCGIALSKIVTAENSEQVEALRTKMKRLVDHINSAKDELYKQKDLANVSEKYWRNVEKARNYYIEQLESLFPGINLSEKKLNLKQDELDIFIMHAFTHVLTYQKELERLQTDGELRLKRAIEAVRGSTDSEALKEQAAYYLESAKAELALDNQKRILKIHSEAENLLRSQLKKQAEAHTDHLKDVVAQRESELKRSFEHELEDKLETEKANYKLQLAAMLGKLRGMDAAIQARADTERSAHQAQALWAACQALWASVRTVVPGVHYKEKLRPLNNEIAAIAKAAEGDELVHTVINNLPKEARQRGIFPEEALRERFINVERVARKVAIVPEEGASIPIYILSYLQSLLILKPENPVSKDELEDKPFDFTKLDTYDILNRTRYFVDRGDFIQAIKYINLLKGAPRKVASDWVHEVRLMLETQQAANLLMAHAASSGLLYL